MYTKEIINNLVNLINKNIGAGNKDVIAEIVRKEFSLQKKGAVLFCDAFAIRFCSTKKSTETVSNTVMALKHIKTFNDRPIIVCTVGPTNIYFRLANATFIKKVSHSSMRLRIDNIVGNINYSDIMKEYGGIDNIPENFERLFGIHSGILFDDNLERIVSVTSEIVPTGKRFAPTEEQRKNILEAPNRAFDFIMSGAYTELKEELNHKTEMVADDLLLIEKSYANEEKMRGNLIEYFIKSTDELKKRELREKIKNNEVIDDIVVENGLGDYSVEKDGYTIETDIKSKVTSLNSAPKGYNVDKLLEFLSNPSSIYLLYIVAMNGEEKLQTELTSIFQEQILEKTRVQPHWAGRNSRGVAQFDGHTLEYFMKDNNIHIEIERARRFLEGLLDDTTEEEDD